MEAISPSEEVLVCQTCGDKGFTNAYVYCVKCVEFVVHRYCLNVIPKTLDEIVIWYCDQCKPTVQDQVTSPEVSSSPSEKNEVNKNIDPIWSESSSLDSNSCSSSSNQIGFDEWEARKVEENQKGDRILDDFIMACPVYCLGDNPPRERKRSDDGEQTQSSHHKKKKKNKGSNIASLIAETKEVISHCLPKESSTNMEKIADNDYQVPNCENNSQVKDKRAKPIIDPVWRGSFSVDGKEFVGHLSDQAFPKDSEEANVLPSLLHLEMHPKSLVWPKGFQDTEVIPDKTSPGSIKTQVIPDKTSSDSIKLQVVPDKTSFEPSKSLKLKFILPPTKQEQDHKNDVPKKTDTAKSILQNAPVIVAHNPQQDSETSKSKGQDNIQTQKGNAAKPMTQGRKKSIARRTPPVKIKVNVNQCEQIQISSTEDKEAIEQAKTLLSIQQSEASEKAKKLQEIQHEVQRYDRKYSKRNKKKDDQTSYQAQQVQDLQEDQPTQVNFEKDTLIDSEESDKDKGDNTGSSESDGEETETETNKENETEESYDSEDKEYIVSSESEALSDDVLQDYYISNRDNKKHFPANQNYNAIDTEDEDTDEPNDLTHGKITNIIEKITAETKKPTHSQKKRERSPKESQKNLVIGETKKRGPRAKKNEPKRKLFEDDDPAKKQRKIRRTKKEMEEHRKAVAEGKKMMQQNIQNDRANNENKFSPLRNRVATDSMIRVLKSLSTKQKKIVKDLGLQSMLHLEMDVMVATIGHHVVDNYDPTTDTIRVDHSRIEITEDKIHHILGVPITGIDLDKVQNCPEDDETYIQWTKQRIKGIQSLVDRIEQSKEADKMFVLNFLILFVNSMICRESSGQLYTKLVMKLVKLHDKININWCKFIHKVLRKSKRKWVPHDQSKFYNGPIPYLILQYVHATSCGTQYVNRRVPPTVFWNSGRLRIRESNEIKQGAFGRVEMVAENYQFDEPTDQISIDNEQEMEKETGVKSVYMKLENQYKLIEEIKESMKETLKSGLEKYPGDEVIKSWTWKYHEMFKKTPGVENSGTKHGEGKNFGEETEKNNDTEADKVGTVEPVKKDEEKNKKVKKAKAKAKKGTKGATRKKKNGKKDKRDDIRK